MSKGRHTHLKIKDLPKSVEKKRVPAVPKIDMGDTGCRVVRKKVETVTLYEVKESELDALEKGRQSDIFLNFAIFCYSVMLTCVVALITCTFSKPIFEIAFFCMTVIGVIIGTILLVLWLKSKDSIKEIIKTIKSRNE